MEISTAGVHINNYQHEVKFAGEARGGEINIMLDRDTHLKGWTTCKFNVETINSFSIDKSSKMSHGDFLTAIKLIM